MESELENFKNVEYGDIRYVNYSNAEYRAELKEPDINGIYGQNGSGKTAMIEALDMLQRIMGGKTISYEEYAGMFPENRAMKLSTVFFIECGEKKYKARYGLSLKKNTEERRKRIEDKKAHRRKSVKKKYIITSVITVVIVGIIAAGVMAFMIPNNKYKDAKKMLSDKKYEQAVKEFSTLKGFLKSEAYLSEAYYNLGLQSMEKDEQTAIDYFKKSHDADKKSQHGIMAGAFLDYYDGVAALDSKEYDKSMELFKASANAASDFNLVNKASAGMAQVYYLKGDYNTAWNTIKNVFAKDQSYEGVYGTYGYAYAKKLVDSGKIKEGMTLYKEIAQYTKAENLNENVYKQAVKLGESGKMTEAVNLLKSVRKENKKADKLYQRIKNFEYKVRFWVGTWSHKGIVNGEKKVYKIYISTVLFKGEPCLRIKDQNNKVLGFDTVISSKNKVSQIEIGTYKLHFKLRKFHNQKFAYTLKGGKKMIRAQRYDKKTYTSKYKKKSK